MLPLIEKYLVFPSVFPANTESVITVVPRERAFIFSEGEECTVRMVAVDTQFKDVADTSFTVAAKDGVLKFSFHFLDEQEYKIIVTRNEKDVVDTALYSLNPDLYSLFPLMGDLHSHSTRSDGGQDPATLAGFMRERGYDFYAMTDHHRYYPSEEVRDALSGLNCGLVALLGEEVHAPGTPLHVVHLGGEMSVNEQYVMHREEYDAEIAEIEKRVPQEIPEHYKAYYARAMWASEHIRSVGGLAVMAHPFWRSNGSKRHNIATDFAKILLKSGLFDVYELIGAMGQQENNASVALWSELKCEGLSIPVVGSSDVHGVHNNRDFPWQRTIAFAAAKEPGAIIEAIKKGSTVAVEITGTDYDTQYRAYGSLRYVNYAQFLLRYYFNRIERLTFGEGVAMRDYVMGDAPKELVEIQAAHTKLYSDRFFGRASAPEIGTELLSKKAVFDEKHNAYTVVK